MKSMYEKERAKSLSHFTFGISVDCVVFGFDGSDVKVLVIKRGTEPYKDFQAIPGDLVHEKEDPIDATKRVLNELTGLKDIYLEQLKAFAGVNRHPLGRVVETPWQQYSTGHTNPASWRAFCLPS